jgi:hypothetical protein
MTDKKTRLDRYALSWESVKEELLKKDQSANKVAVLEAEKILRLALEDQELPGESIDDILAKNAKLFTNSDKLRYSRAMWRKLVEKIGFDISGEDTKEILKGYHDAVLDLENMDYARLPLSDRFNIFLKRNFTGLGRKARVFSTGLLLFSLLTFLLTETQSGRELAARITNANNYLYYTLLPAAFIFILLFGAAVMIFYAYKNRQR